MTAPAATRIAFQVVKRRLEPIGPTVMRDRGASRRSTASILCSGLVGTSTSANSAWLTTTWAAVRPSSSSSSPTAWRSQFERPLRGFLAGSDAPHHNLAVESVPDDHGAGLLCQHLGDGVAVPLAAHQNYGSAHSSSCTIENDNH
jgi:hypothetical protein